MSSCVNPRNTCKNCQSAHKAVGKGWWGGSSEPDILSEVNALKTLEGGRIQGRDGQVNFKRLDFLLGSLKSTQVPGTEELVCQVCGSCWQRVLLLNSLFHLWLQTGVFGAHLFISFGSLC